MTDIRLDVEFFDHPKTRKLIRRTGLEGVIALQRLWMWCAKNRPDGNLSGMDMEDIALAAHWDGEESEENFVQALVALHWIDETPDGYVLHDWQEHNPWAAQAENRGDKARLSKLAQVNTEAYREFVEAGRTGISKDEYLQAAERPQTKRSANICDRRAAAERPQTKRSAPSPSPSPTPNPSPPPPIVPPLPPEGGDADAADEPLEKVEQLPVAVAESATTTPTVAENATVPGAVDHMTTPEAVNLYRQCFPTRGLTPSPMVIAKLSVWCSQFSRAEMQHAFTEAGNAGATSLNYLEAVLEGKGRPRAAPPNKTEEAKGRLAAWIGEDWLRKEIAVGVMRLWADGERSGRPAADVLVVTAANIEDELRKYQLTPQETDRVKAAFDEARRHCRGWPQAREICDFLPRRREQLAIEENTAPKQPLRLMEGFRKVKEEMHGLQPDAGGKAPDHSRGAAQQAL